MSIDLQYGFWCWADNSTHSFVQLTATSTSHTYYCINFPSGLREYLEERLKTCRPHPIYSLFIDIMIMKYVLRGYQQGLTVQKVKLQRIVSLNTIYLSKSVNKLKLVPTL